MPADGRRIDEKVELHDCDDDDAHEDMKCGGPFSALTSSMKPQHLTQELQQIPEDEAGQLDYRYDEFGFKVEVEDGPEENSSKLLSTPFVEDSKHRLKWIAYLEFSQNQDLTNKTLDQMDPNLVLSQKLYEMILNEGIPHTLRPHIWPRLCGAFSRRDMSRQSYQDVVKVSSNDNLISSKQIEKDLLRTIPRNVCFSSIQSTGVGRLRRILRSIAWLYPDVGYCQGMGVIIASLLLFMEEEDTFWLMCSIIEDLLPSSYFSSSLLGIQADQHVLIQLTERILPGLHQLLQTHDIALPLITLHWFLTLFSSVVHTRILLRILDLFFYKGAFILFQITLGLLKLKEPEILQSDSASQILSRLSDIPSQIDDADELITAALEISKSLSEEEIASLRKKQLAILMAGQGAIINPEQTKNLPKEKLSKRHIPQSVSMLSYILWGDNEQSEDGKAKNVKQTELLVDLRAAILKIGNYFQSVDPSNKHMNLNADYSPESHSLDLDHYIRVVQRRRRRAKALVDFEKHDHDELGFKRNDIINLVATGDEHCWVGECNGRVGWFPAKFVELLDERSKDYSLAGDDSVSTEITDLVRGCLCPAIKAILEHGLKKSILLAGSSHPWLFIEEAVKKIVEKDYQSTYARLMLCKTFRLEEDGKVLTPEEVLFKAVQAVNATHDAVHAQMDVKLRSLICCGLNEQALHLWVECLCSCEDIVKKWYHDWSFLRSPGWVQIKCDLRVLTQFAFHLERDHEIIKKQKKWENDFLNNVQEMLTKYHLFSWDMQ